MPNEICWVVGNEAGVTLVTADKTEARSVCTAKKAEFPALNWKVRTVREAVWDAYEEGRKIGFEDGQDSME